MTLLPTTMEGPFSPTDRQRELMRRPTGDKEQGSVNGDDSDEEDEDDEKDDEDDDEAIKAPQDPVKAAFDEILAQIKNKELKLGKSEERKKFFQKYDQFLESQIGEKKNLLHVLSYFEGWGSNVSLKSLITQFSKKYPEKYSRLLVLKDDTAGENNPLYAAIFRKNAKLVGYMCENKENSQTISRALTKALSMTCGERSENCIHAAIRFKLPSDVAIELIKRTGELSEKTLSAKDSKGFTPLHYAVEYERCTESQFEVVQTLIQYGNSALDQLSNKPDYFSVYRYHESTREKYIALKTPIPKKAPDIPKERQPGPKDGEMKPPDGPISKQAKATEELDPKRKAAQAQKKEKEILLAAKEEMNQRDSAGAKRRESIFNSTPGLRDDHSQAQNGHPQGGQEALAVPGSPTTDTSKATQSYPSKTAGLREGVEQKRRRNDEPGVTKESAEKIRQELHLHYLRTRSPEVAACRLYGKNPDEIQICFDYQGGQLKVDPEAFKESLEHLVFDPVLQYVRFPKVQVYPQPELLSSFGNPPEVAGRGRSDMTFFFDWLREDKKVKRILKVEVDDSDDPAHSDEAIENALHGFDVEILDWRKVDLCSETMYRSSTKLKEVYLRWSGNNTVLRAWSEVDGLKKFENLTKVHLHVKQDLESSIRTTDNINQFCDRLRSAPPPLPWQHISIGLRSFPKDKHKYDTVCIFVCRIRRHSYSVPCHKDITAEGVARLFLAGPGRIHGPPGTIVCDTGDKGPEFIATFWKELCRLLGIKLELSTASYPKTDGPTEIINQYIDQRLCPLIKFYPENWSDFLPVLDYAQATLPHESTELSPVQIQLGYVPRTSFDWARTEHGQALSLPAELPVVGHKIACPIDVARIEKGGRNERLLTTNFSTLPGDIKLEPTLHPHRWLEVMDNFADQIQNVWNWAMKQKLHQQTELQKPVEVALIDDGVDVLQTKLRGKISNGKSFDYGNQGENRMRPHWISERGHGTVMARNIARVCPMVKIYVIRLETQYDHKDQKTKIGARSAAEAIDAAVDRDVQIISMSWTIKQPENNSPGKKKFDDAVRRAVDKGILMFCSAGDKGSHQDNDYPAASSPGKMLRIGAAKANGNVWDWAGDINNLDFIIPGHQVIDRASEDEPPQNFQEQTGSSVATALGAGLAALIICCVQLAAIHTQMSAQVAQAGGVAPAAVTAKDLIDVKKHDSMKLAFDTIGTSRESQNKFIEVWRIFDKPAKEMKPLEKERRLGVVAALAPKFVRLA